jgi:hypothetical protein
VDAVEPFADEGFRGGDGTCDGVDSLGDALSPALGDDVGALPGC